MESLIILIAATGLFVALMTYGLASAWRRVLQENWTPPLLVMLRLRGRTAEQLLDDVGPEAMAIALRRCRSCSSGELCRQSAATAQQVAGYCPNAAIIGHA